MDRIAQLPPQERSELFRSAAQLRPVIPPAFMGKDFWVCWTLHRLVPDASRQDALRQDYAAMREMVFGDLPAFQDILTGLADLEKAIGRRWQGEGR